MFEDQKEHGLTKKYLIGYCTGHGANPLSWRRWSRKGNRSDVHCIKLIIFKGLNIYTCRNFYLKIFASLCCAWFPLIRPKQTSNFWGLAVAVNSLATVQGQLLYLLLMWGRPNCNIACGPEIVYKLIFLKNKHYLFWLFLNNVVLVARGRYSTFKSWWSLMHVV